MQPSIPASRQDHEIVTIRTFPYSKDIVFEAWSNPDQLAAWWGPKGFTNTFEVFDFRPGGQWKFVMHGPEKGNYKNECEFITIDKPNVIYWKRHSQPLFEVCTTFEEYNGATRLTFRMIFDSPEECEKMKRFVVDKNEENFDKLQNILAG